MKAIKKYENVKLYVPYNSEIEKEAIKWGKAIVYEAFADRNYNENLSLVSRNNENAVLTSSEEIKKHINLMINKSEVKTVTGKKVFIKAATFCVHSDTENVIEIVKSLRS